MSRARFPAILFVLSLFPLLSVSKDDYKRPKWADLDRDCQNTRTEVLVAQCPFVEFKGGGRCSVAAATCLDLYAGVEVASTSASKTFDVDHLFSAHQAWLRRAWTKEEFVHFFNDEDNLVLTTFRTNRRKSERMPQDWCPSSRGARMLAGRRITRVVERYHLSLTSREQAGVNAWLQGACSPGARVL